jgi:hypothetical protein
MSSRFINVVTNNSISFFLKAEYYSIVKIVIVYLYILWGSVALTIISLTGRQALVFWISRLRKTFLKAVLIG